MGILVFGSKEIGLAFLVVVFKPGEQIRIAENGY